MTDILVILMGYLLGSLPFAYLITRLFTGKDIRFEGEGNVGTRNVLYVVGPVAGLLTLILDGSKGAAAYLVAARWGSGTLVVYLTGFALMLGHGFPIWLHFRGGKGLAAAAGFLFEMWPYSLIATLVIFMLAKMVIHDFNLSVAVGGALFPFLTFLEGNDLRGFAFICLLLGIAGLKKLVDLPHERAIRAKSGWIEGRHAIAQAGPQNGEEHKEARC